MSTIVTIEIKTWAEFKGIQLLKNFPFQYNETENFYDIYIADTLTWHIRLQKGSIDSIDFENNFKSNANKLIINSIKITDNNAQNLIGELQSSPTQYTLLARLKDLWDKLHDLFVNGLAKVKLWDGTYQANITSDGKLKVETYSATGISNNTIIKDGTGGDFLAKVDSQGRLYTYIPPSQNNITIQIMIDDIVTPIKALQWNELVSYTVPTNYDLNCIVFDAYDSVNNGKARAVIKRNAGSFNMSTGIFEDLNSFILPRFGTKLYACITSPVGTSNDTITITYTNSLGVIGRKTTIVLKSNNIGEKIEIPLQSGDSGILDITDVTQSLTEAGVFTLEIVHSLFQNLLPTNGVLYQTIAPLSSIVVPAGETVYLQYNPSNGASVVRRVSIVGALVPR